MSEAEKTDLKLTLGLVGTKKRVPVRPHLKPPPFSNMRYFVHVKLYY